MDPTDNLLWYVTVVNKHSATWQIAVLKKKSDNFLYM